MKNPKISVIIPVYNAKSYILEAIESVRKQDYEGEIQLMVIDNESTDGTYELLVDKIGGQYDIIFLTAENKYKYSWDEPTRLGLQYMEGSEYFMFMAADDLLQPNFISNCMKIIMKAPEKIKALQSPVQFFGGWNHQQKYEYKNLDEFKKQMLQRSVVNTPTIIWHRSFYDDGLMELTEPEEYYGADDYALYCALATRGHFIWPAPKYLGYKYRIHDNNASWGMHKELDGPNVIDKKIQERYRKIWKEETT